MSTHVVGDSNIDYAKPLSINAIPVIVSKSKKIFKKIYSWNKQEDEKHSSIFDFTAAQ